MSDWSTPSLRVRLSVGSAVRLALAIAAFGLIAYQAARRAVLENAGARLRTSAFNFAQRTSLNLQENQRGVAEAAKHPAVIATLRAGAPVPGVDSVFQRISTATPQVAAVGIRSASGQVITASRPLLTDWPLDLAKALSAPRISPLTARADSLSYEIVAPVVEGRDTLGSLTVVRQVISSETSRRTVADLLGSGGILLFGNADGSVWTNLERRVAGPDSTSAVRYAESGVDYLVAGTLIARTPFVIAVALPEQRVLAPAHDLIWKFALVGVLIVVIGLAIGWWSNSRVVEPLTDLTVAAESIAAGQEARHQPSTRGDEIGRLERAFATMAESVRKAREGLEQQVAERTSALEQAQAALVRREKLAALGVLAGSVAHELRNPLGVMSNTVYYLDVAPDLPAAQRKRSLEILRKEIGLATRIVNDLMDFTRVKTPERQPVALRTIVDSQLQRLTKVPHVDIEVVIPDSLPTVHVDPIQVGQVIWNLTVNAVQAVAEGASQAGENGAGSGTAGGGGRGGKVVLRGSSREPNRVSLEVIDTGPGIEPGQLETIFEPLFTTKVNGIGLGLAVSRSFAEANNGELGVRSEVGRGTTFTLVLPATNGALPATTEPEVAA